MNKLLNLLFLIFLPIISKAEDIPNPNAEGIKKVQGVINKIESVNSSQRGSATTGMPVVDLVESIFGSNYSGFPIYFVKINENITLEVANKESFKIGDCVLVWYAQEMGDTPSLSMLGQAGMAKSSGCGK